MAEGTVADNFVFRVTTHFTYNQQRMQTSWHVRDTGLQLRNATDVLDRALPFVETEFAKLLATTARMDRLEVEEIRTKEYAAHEFANKMGTLNVGVGIPTFMAALISLRSNQRARHRNGRMFWPVMDGSGLSGSNLSTTTITAFEGVLEQFRDLYLGNVVTSPEHLVVVAAPREATTHRPAIEWSWIDVETVKLSTLATALRRRKVGVGA